MKTKILIGSLIVAVIFGICLWSVLTKPALAQGVKTVVVEKISTSLAMSNGDGQGKYRITLGCNLLLDGAEQDLEVGQEYLFIKSVDYAMGGSVPGVYQDFEDVFQAEIDEWVAEQAIYNHAQLNTVVSTLQSNLAW